MSKPKHSEVLITRPTGEEVFVGLREEKREVSCWVICRNPADFPGIPYIVRRWVRRTLMDGVEEDGFYPTGEHRPCATLADARDAIPPGHTRLERDPDDEPDIVECWL